MSAHSRAERWVGHRANPVLGAVQWVLDRMVSVGYGVVYDTIVERFGPYRELHADVLRLVEASVPPGTSRRDTRVLDVACGPGNFALRLAAAGFDTVGIDAYAGLVELAREKRKAHRAANLAFRQADLAEGGLFAEDTFDQVVNIHSLYTQPDPQRLLREAHRALKPGGHAVFVNPTRRVRLGTAVREVRRREGTGAALRSLLFVLPNALFETMRKGAGAHYWDREELTARLRQAGFTLLEVRETFFDRVSLLAWVRKDASGAALSAAPPPRAVVSVDTPARGRSRLRRSLERLIAAAYGFTYDAIVRSFEPYQALLREAAGFLERTHPGHHPRSVKVLDVACGTGTVAVALARRGYSVVGLDVVEPLVRRARRRGGSVEGQLQFEHLDVARDRVPDAGTYDAVVSMHTLYWHPDPAALLEGCRRALKPGGHALVLTYSRPARIFRTFAEVRRGQGTAAALRALRWLVPTALFECFRDYEPHYMGQPELQEALDRAGFQVLETRRTFLAGISLLAWVRSDAEGNRTRDERGGQP
jgi:SAM-dependent methyltransferase